MFDHPLVLCLGLVGVSLVLGVSASIIISSWVFISLVLVFLGGIIVILLYISLLSSSDKIFSGFNWIYFIGGVVSIGVICFFISCKRRFAFRGITRFLRLSYLYYSLNFSMLFFITFYLLLTLFLVVIFSESFKGALKKTQ